MGNYPLDGEVPKEFPPLGGTEDSNHGTQMSTVWYIGVLTYWGDTGNGGAGKYWGVY